VAGLATFLSIGLAAPVMAQDFQVPMSADFNDGEIRFTGELGTVYHFRWDAVAVDGQLAICGTGYLRDTRLRSTIRDMARDGEILVGAQLVRVDLRFFSRARTMNALQSTAANCQVVGPSPRDITSIALRFGAGTFRN
jgi:hypothetical protein